MVASTLGFSGWAGEIWLTPFFLFCSFLLAKTWHGVSAKHNGFRLSRFLLSKTHDNHRKVPAFC